MKCPNCGTEAAPNTKFCVSCGSELPVQQPDPVDTVPQEPLHAAPSAPESQTGSGAAPKNVKEFVLQLCSPKFRKEMMSCWILLYVFAGLNLVLELVMGLAPIDAFILAGIGLWMQLTYSRASGICAVAFTLFSVVIILILNHQLTGWLMLIVAFYTLYYTHKATVAYQKYKQDGTLPTL